MEIYSHIIIPLLIFLARIIDVSLGTIRVILISKGQKGIAASLGFIEAGIWLLAIREILNNLNSIIAYIAYPAGFAVGTYVGMILEERLIKGKVVLRVIVKKKKGLLAKEFAKQKLQFTIVDGEGSKGRSKIFFCVMDRKKLDKAIKTIKKYHPKAFYSIENIKFARDPVGERREFQIGNYIISRKAK